MTYRKHGHTPTDDEIARYGYQAFGPRRPDFVPTKDDFARALAQCATGDADELKGMAGEVAALWPRACCPPFWPWAYGWDDDE